MGFSALAASLTLLVIWFVAGGIEPARATVRIVHDGGGRIGTYMDRYRRLRDSGERVIIDGDCISACTLVIRYVPRERVCVTAKARLGFHRAWKPTLFGFHTYNAVGTAILFTSYPAAVQNWIAQKGGLTDDTLYLSGPELLILYNKCPPDGGH